MRLPYFRTIGKRRLWQHDTLYPIDCLSWLPARPKSLMHAGVYTSTSTAGLSLARLLIKRPAELRVERKSMLEVIRRSSIHASPAHDRHRKTCKSHHFDCA